MEEASVLEKRIAVLRRGVADLPNVSLGSMSVRQAIWQSYITKAGTDAAEVLEAAAAGQGLSSLLRQFDERIRPWVFEPAEGSLPWQFMRTAKGAG